VKPIAQYICNSNSVQLENEKRKGERGKTNKILNQDNLHHLDDNNNSNDNVM
jgi:hypothetical protein